MAEIITLPEGADAAAFAGDLIEREGLTPWNPAEPTSSNARSRLSYKARHAGNGREVTVYYDRDRSPANTHICRVRRASGGVSDAHYAAVTWCAASFGIAMPVRRPPAIVKDSGPR